MPLPAVESSDARAALIARYFARYPQTSSRPNVVLREKSVNVSNESPERVGQAKNGKRSHSNCLGGKGVPRPAERSAMVGSGRTVYSIRPSSGSSYESEIPELPVSEMSVGKDEGRSSPKASCYGESFSYHRTEDTVRGIVRENDRRLAAQVVWAGRDEMEREERMFQARYGDSPDGLSPSSTVSPSSVRSEKWSLDNMWDCQTGEEMQVTSDTCEADNMFDMFIDVQECGM